MLGFGEGLFHDMRVFLKTVYAFMLAWIDHVLYPLIMSFYLPT